MHYFLCYGLIFLVFVFDSASLFVLPSVSFLLYTSPCYHIPSDVIRLHVLPLCPVASPQLMCCTCASNYHHPVLPPCITKVLIV